MIENHNTAVFKTPTNCQRKLAHISSYYERGILWSFIGVVEMLSKCFLDPQIKL